MSVIFSFASEYNSPENNSFPLLIQNIDHNWWWSVAIIKQIFCYIFRSTQHPTWIRKWSLYFQVPVNADELFFFSFTFYYCCYYAQHFPRGPANEFSAPIIRSLMPSSASLLLIDSYSMIGCKWNLVLRDSSRFYDPCGSKSEICRATGDRGRRGKSALIWTIRIACWFSFHRSLSTLGTNISHAFCN